MYGYSSSFTFGYDMEKNDKKDHENYITYYVILFEFWIKLVISKAYF